MRSRPEGIDISNHQGATFDWNKWKGQIEFGMVKATESDNFKDPDFHRNWNQMHDLGIHRFAYHFARPSESTPYKQAKYFTDFVKANGIKQGDNLVLDIEDAGGMTPKEVSFWVWTFCREVNDLAPGHRILVYTFEAFAREGYVSMSGDRHLWIAEYDVPAPSMPCGPWKTWTFWQWAGNTVDRDVFNGNELHLKRFCAKW